MSTLSLIKPLVVFDLETTGVNVNESRIIQLALLRLNPDGTTKELNLRFNPEVAIEPEATAIHGITNDMLANESTFASLAGAIWSVFEGCDLAGFNVEKFDIPLLTATFNRLGFTPPAEGHKVVDVMTIYHKNEKRDLPSAVRFYLNKLHLGAHDAMADVRATLDILNTQIVRYGLGDQVEHLSNYCHEKPKEFVDDDGKFIWRADKACVSFGKHLGRSLQEMSQQEPGYLNWMLNGSFSPSTKELAYNALQGIYPTRG